jgi:hypothetical protein
VLLVGNANLEKLVRADEVLSISLADGIVQLGLAFGCAERCVGSRRSEVDAELFANTSGLVLAERPAEEGD